MKKLALILAALATWPAHAADIGVPFFNVDRFCNHRADCVDNEQLAYDDIVALWPEVPDRNKLWFTQTFGNQLPYSQMHHMVVDFILTDRINNPRPKRFVP